MAAEPDNKEPTAMEAAAALAKEVEASFKKRLQFKKNTDAWASWRASGLSDECERRVYYRRANADQFPPISDGLSAIFHAGDMLEPAVRRLLSEMGYEIEAAQVGFPANEQGITGHIDGIVRWKGRTFIAEIKTVGHLFDRINSADDLKSGTGFIRKWYGQFVLYLYLSEQEAGILFLYEKLGGRLKAIPIVLDYEEAEALLQRAERLNAAISEGAPPPHIQDWTVCKSCPVMRFCDPPFLTDQAQVKIINDPEMVELADVMAENKEAHGLYEDAKKRLAGSLRGVTEADLGGKYVVRGAWSSYTTYNIPKEVKEQFKVVNPQGRFTFHLEPVGGD